MLPIPSIGLKQLPSAFKCITKWWESSQRMTRLIGTKVDRRATIGMQPSEAANASKLCLFVQNWSGRAKGEILKHLESYEKTLIKKHYILQTTWKSWASATTSILK